MSRNSVIVHCAIVPRAPRLSARRQLLCLCSCRAPPRPHLPSSTASSFSGDVSACSAASTFCGDLFISSSSRSHTSSSRSSPLCRERFISDASGRFVPRRTRSCSQRRVELKSQSEGSEGESERSARTESEREGEKRSGKRSLVEGTRRASVVRVAETTASTMSDILDLEKQFSFYGAYHSNKVNVLIHMLFVWPIFYTSLILWAYTAPFAPLPLAAGTLPLQEYMVLNASFVPAAIYGLYYIALDKKAGSIGALICLGCWIGANAVAQALPWSLSWRIVLASQVTCWFFQIFGHAKFEGRAPALLDNLPQAFVMAPFFVLLECLQAFGYEPYPGFRRNVQKNVDDAIREFKESKAKKAA